MSNKYKLKDKVLLQRLGDLLIFLLFNDTDNCTLYLENGIKCHIIFDIEDSN